MDAMVNDKTARLPDTTVSVAQLFNIESNLEVPAYSEKTDLVPDIDEDYIFDRQTTLAILADHIFCRT